MNTQVKICGLACEQDVIETIALKPDALGFNFWAKSPRAVSAGDVAAWTRDRVPEPMRKVGIFVDPSLEEVMGIAEEAGLDVIQLHGSEGLDIIRSITLPVWKALHLDRLPTDWQSYPVEAFLIDSGTVDMPGGTGKQLDADRARNFISQSDLPVWLAGGLNAGNVGDAIRKVLPFGVDVSSGVETSPGRKDISAVREFIASARTISKEK